MEEAKVNLFAISMAAEYQLFRVTVFITRSTSDRWEAVKANYVFLDKLKNKSYFLAHCAKTVQFAYPPYEQKAGDCWLFFRDLQNFWRSNFDRSTHILQIKKLHKKSSACYQTSSLIYDKGQGGWLHC